MSPNTPSKPSGAQTGVRPVTLRAWERRHEVLTPIARRTAIGCDSERDVAILRWLKDRTDSGLSISEAVAELRQMVRNGLWPEAVPTAPQGRHTGHRCCSRSLCHPIVQGADPP